MKLPFMAKGDHESTRPLKQYPYTERRPEATVAAMAAFAVGRNQTIVSCQRWMSAKSIEINRNGGDGGDTLTLIFGVVQVRVVHDRRRAGVDGLHAPGQLAPEDVVGFEARGL